MEKNNFENLQFQEFIQIKKWISKMPSRDKKNIKNILSINSYNSKIDKQIINLFSNIEHYNILEDAYDVYKSYIDNLWGDFRFKISKNNLENFIPDPNISYDLVIFFNVKEEDDGGHLILGNPHTGEEVTFDYGPNKVILFPNTPNSWHKITARKPTKYPRRFICLEIKTTKVRLHSYKAVNGKDTMKTFDVENYYG